MITPNSSKKNEIIKKDCNNNIIKNFEVIQNKKILSRTIKLNSLKTISRGNQRNFTFKRKNRRKESTIKNLLEEQNTNSNAIGSAKNFSIFFSRKIYKKKTKKRKIIKDEYGRKSYISDEQVNQKEYNSIPYEQALRIDKRGYYDIFLSILAHEIKIIDIFYYRNPYFHLSIIISIYLFELCLDLTLNCLLYTDDVVSEKYNNNGSIGFFTSLSLSFMSNIFAGMIAYIIGKLADYADTFELMMKETIIKKQYFWTMVKFKKYLTLKMTGFYIIQTIINLCMCYYLMIFCTVYHKTQGSIMINYLLGIAESMAISFGLAIITSLFRFFSLQYKWRSIYYTSKFFFEHF